jgi:anaphase-promoting complex subunit 4
VFRYICHHSNPLQGLKRWDHSIAQGYTKVLELLQESLLPALDRCSIVLSSLQGLAQYHEHSPAFDVSISSFSMILDIIKCIRLMAHHLIVWAAEEYQRFNAFLAWLKHMIAVLRSDPTTATSEDLYEDDHNIEYHFVLAYIEGPMQRSKLDAFFAAPIDGPDLVANPNIYGETKKALDVFKEKWVLESKLLNLSSYYSEWSRHNRALIEQITAWQRSNTILPGGFVVADGKSKHHDLRMVSEVSTLIRARAELTM